MQSEWILHVKEYFIGPIMTTEAVAFHLICVLSIKDLPLKVIKSIVNQMISMCDKKIDAKISSIMYKEKKTSSIISAWG